MSTLLFLIPILILLVTNLSLIRTGYSKELHIVCIVIICIAWITRESIYRRRSTEKYDQIVAGTVYNQTPLHEDEYSNGLGWIL